MRTGRVSKRVSSSSVYWRRNLKNIVSLSNFDLSAWAQLCAQSRFACFENEPFNFFHGSILKSQRERRHFLMKQITWIVRKLIIFILKLSYYLGWENNITVEIIHCRDYPIGRIRIIISSIFLLLVKFQHDDFQPGGWPFAFIGSTCCDDGSRPSQWNAANAIVICSGSNHRYEYVSLLENVAVDALHS